ncbi:hypothetical protein M8J77_022850 [Diaphorina citri]|nr:hypothetical protein M8J77_022850 [Diaphorina citri]
MDQVSQAPTKKILKRRLNETSVSRTSSPTSLKQNTTVSMINETVELEDAVSVSGESTYTSEEPLAGRQSIAACLQDIDSGLVGHTKRRDDLLVSIRNKKEELREKNERTAELRNKNEEISLMIQAEDKDMSVITDNLTKELDTFRFFETQVLSSREHIQKLKREVNRNKMKQAENMNLVKSGMESLGRLKAELEAGLAAKERECLAYEEEARALGDPAEIYATLLRERERLAALREQSEAQSATLEGLKQKLRQGKERKRQVEEEYERKKEEERMMKEELGRKRKCHEELMAEKKGVLETKLRQKEMLEQMLGLEKQHLERMKKSLAGHESERNAMRETLDQTAQRYKQLQEEISAQNLRRDQTTTETDAKNLELEQAKSRLFAGRQTLSLKQTQLDQSKSEVEELSRTLDEKEARRGQLEREIEEKRRERERRLEVLMEEMEGKCQREMQALEEELEERKKEVEAKIEQIEKDTAMLQQEQEHLLLSHTATMETLHQEQATWCVKTNAAQNELNEFQLNIELLRAKLASLQQTSDEEREKLRGEMERMRGEMEEKGRQRQEEVEGVMERKREMERIMEEAKERHGAVLKENEEALGILAEINDRVEQHKAHAVTQYEKITQLRTQIEEEAKEKENISEQIDQLNSEKTQMSAQCSTFLAQLEEVSEANRRVIDEIEQHNARLALFTQEEQQTQKEIGDLDESLEKLKMQHLLEKQEWTLDQENQLRALDDKKGVEKAKFKAQYEKLVAMYENVAKASRDAADELMVHRNARERIVQGLQGLMKEKENQDREYKKYQENMLKIQKLLTDLDKSTK